MNIAAANFTCFWAETIYLAAYLKIRLEHKYLPSSVTPWQQFHRNRPTILYLTPFRNQCYVHIQVEEHSTASKHRLRAHKAIVVIYTSSSTVYGVLTLEDQYVVKTQVLTFPNIDFFSGSDNSGYDFLGPGTGPLINSPGPRPKAPLYNYVCLYDNS
jgi:hypothetical protein